MATTNVKQGDTGLSVLRQLQLGGTPYDVSAANLKILVSGADDATLTALYTRRDVTTLAKANGVAALGKVAIPIWNGRTLPGAASSSYNVLANEQIVVTAAAGGGTTVTQEIYMSKAGTTTPLYLVASGATGFAAAGYSVNVADASMVTTVVPTENQSATEGGAAAPTPPTATLAGGAAGVMTNGTHVVKIVNRTQADSDTIRKIRFEIIVYDEAAAADVTFPEDGFEYLNVTTDV